MTDKSGTHYHRYATRSEHNTSPPPVPSCRSPTTATMQRHDRAIIPNARPDTTTSWESIHHQADRNLKPPDTNPHPETVEILARTPPRKNPAIHRPAHRNRPTAQHRKPLRVTLPRPRSDHPTPPAQRPESACPNNKIKPRHSPGARSSQAASPRSRASLGAGPATDHQPQSSSPARHQVCSNNPSRAPLRRTWSTTSRPPARALTSSSLAVISVSPSNGSGPHKPLNTLYSELSASARRSDESAPLNLSGSRRTSTAIRAARPLSSSGYFLDTLMTPILLCIHRLHQTRDDTGSHTATSSTPPPSPAASPSSRTPSSAWPRTRPTSARLTQIPSIPPDAHKGVRVRQAS